MKYLKGLERSSLAGLALCAAFAQAGGLEAVPGEYVIKMRSHGISTMSAGQRLSSLGFDSAESLDAEGTYLVKSSALAGDLVTMSDDIEYVEPNYIFHTMNTSAAREVDVNDARFGEQWALRNSGQSIGTKAAGKAGIDTVATKAWLASKGSSEVVVAIVDTGVDYTHPDLAGNAWTKPGTSDVHGYNAVTDEEDPMDDSEHSHGTHCAGVIGAASDNGKGIAGINWNSSLMGVKFLTASGSGSLAGAIKAINYAANNGARVINASWGGGGYSRALEDAIAQAGSKGVLFVAAAGNDGTNNDKRPTYPAGFKLDNIVAVAAHDNRDQLADFSNYGVASVLLAAPGVDILSTLTGGRYGYLDGTSMATPHVTGAAALLLSLEPGLTPTQLKARLAESASKSSAYNGTTISGGRLNLAKLLKVAD